MRITVHRGQNQIGGSIIEIAASQTKIILDAGTNLDEEMDAEVPMIDGLFCGDANYDAIIVSHYHADHVGLLGHAVPDIPIYMGRRAYGVLRAACEYKGKDVGFGHLEYEDGTTFTVGELSITPYLCDHSAFDSYMFVITDNIRTVLYTGDFRSNGRKEFDGLLRRLPKVDAIIIEGTMLSRETYENNVTEQELEEIAVKALMQCDGPAFLLTSAMNVDRIMTGYRAARRTDRVFLEDLYTAGIMNSVGEGYPSPQSEGVKVFLTRNDDRQYEMLQRYGYSKIGRNEISKMRYIMCIRPSMKAYLNKLNAIMSLNGGILFYGIWKGYQEREDMKGFLEYMEMLGVRIHVLHTSGHADEMSIRKLVACVEPRKIIPVHTTNPEWFERLGAEVVIDDKDIYA